MSPQFNPAKFLILGFSGPRPDPEFLSLISKYPPAGFLFLAENYQDYRQIRTLIAALKEIAGADALFMVDQEPGRVQRLKSGFPFSRMPVDYVSNDLIQDYASWCRQTAEMMAELGLNMNLAPMLDLCPFNRKFPVLDNRSFGDNPKLVSLYAETLIRQFQELGVSTCGKHFPGLGSATGDPHEIMAYSEDPPERFWQYHWLPFKAAIGVGVDALMTTHLLVASLDNHNIATCSEKIIDALRMQLNFGGPIISDDLYMAGAGKRDQMGKLAANAIVSGHNLLIISRDSAAQLSVIQNLKKQYAEEEKFATITVDRLKYLEKLNIKGGGSHA